MKRQLSEQEKQTVRKQQLSSDGSLRCFISGEIISGEDEIEYDHIHPYAKDGETSTANIRIVLKEYNRRKSDQSLYDVRDNLRLERLFEQKKNHIKLQDIFELKEISRKNTHATTKDGAILIDDGADSREFRLFHDDILDVDYFYGRIPISWLENDDQEGLQPRVIDYKRLITIRDHLKSHPQLAPSIGRLLDGRLRLFDGQHKLAGQVLNNHNEVDVKIYVSSNDPGKSKKLFDDLMITNLEAHSKLKQVPFYTSTLLDRLSVIYKDLLEEFISSKPVETHTDALPNRTAMTQDVVSASAVEPISSTNFLPLGKAETIRQNALFKDFFLLAEYPTSKMKCLYVIGKEYPLKFLGSRRTLASVMSRHIKLWAEFQSKYGARYATVGEYYSDRRDEVRIEDVSDFIGGVVPPAGAVPPGDDEDSL